MNSSLNPSRLIFVPVIWLFVMGLVMIFNTSSAEILDLASSKGTHSALLKQILYGMIGAFCALSVWKMGFEKLIENSPKALIFLSFLLLLVFVPGIGVVANGARRWISIFGVSVQPSEFVKLFSLLYFVKSIRNKELESLDLRAFLKLIAPLGIPLFLILIEPNNGTTGVIVLALVTLFFLAKVPLRFWFLPLVVSGVLVVGFALHMPYVQARLKVYLHPELDLKGKGHQPYQAKIAAGSGGVWGRGPGKSVQKLSYLPEAQNDYIAAIYAEEYGFIGIVVLLGLYAWIVFLGLKIAFYARTKEGMFIAAGISFYIGFQAFLNLGVVSGLLPSTGLNLPFFSQGGSSLIANMIGLGLLVSIYEKSAKKELVEAESG